MKPFKLDDDPHKETGFTVPDGYFEDFSQKMAEKLAFEPKVRRLSTRKTTWYSGIAAILVIGLGLTASHFFQPSDTTAAPDAASIENYLATQRSTEDNLTELLENEDLSQMQFGNALDDKAVEDLLAKNPNLEQYIID